MLVAKKKPNCVIKSVTWYYSPILEPIHFLPFNAIVKRHYGLAPAEPDNKTTIITSSSLRVLIVSVTTSPEKKRLDNVFKHCCQHWLQPYI